MSETYTSGITVLKELGNSMQNKASSDLKQINSTIATRGMAIEQVWYQRGNFIAFS